MRKPCLMSLCDSFVTNADNDSVMFPGTQARGWPAVNQCVHVPTDPAHQGAVPGAAGDLLQHAERWR